MTQANGNQPVLERELVGHWPLVDSLNDSAGSHDLTAPRGSPQFVSKSGRNAVSLDGDDALLASRGGHGQLSQLSKGGDGLTISLWAFFDQPTGGNPFGDSDTAFHAIVRNDTGYRVAGIPAPAEDAVNIHFRVSPYGNAPANGYGMPDDSEVLIPIQEWHHLAIRAVPESSVDIYVDGVLEFSDENMTGYNGPSDDFWSDITIGSWYGGNPEEWANLMRGGLSDVRIYGTPLSSERISEIVNNTSSEPSTPTSTPKSTSTPTTTRTRTRTQTTTSPGPQIDGTVVGEVKLNGQQYLVLQEIPDQPADKYGFVTGDRELVGPETATSVAVSHRFGENYHIDSQERLEYTNNKYAEYENLESLARTASLVSQLSGAIALAKLDPASSASRAVETLQEAIEWGTTDYSDPYAQQYAKMAATSSTVTWANEHASNPGTSFADFSTSALEVGQVMIDTAADLGSISDLATAAQTVQDVLSTANSIRSSVSIDEVSGIDDLRSAGYTVVANLATDAAVGALTDIAETQAKIGALGAGGCAARRPLLREIIELEQQLRDDRLGPTGILRLQSLRQTDYQIEAAALDAMATLLAGLSDGPLGPLYDAIYQVGQQAETAQELSKVWRDLSITTIGATGKEFRQGIERYQNSVNHDEYGAQEVFNY
jgi:hypothetical protein